MQVGKLFSRIQITLAEAALQSLVPLRTWSAYQSKHKHDRSRSANRILKAVTARGLYTHSKEAAPYRIQ